MARRPPSSRRRLTPANRRANNIARRRANALAARRRINNARALMLATLLQSLSIHTAPMVVNRPWGPFNRNRPFGVPLPPVVLPRRRNNAVPMNINIGSNNAMNYNVPFEWRPRR